MSAYEVPGQLDHSAKTKTLINIGKERLWDKGSKIVIFPQWTFVLGHYCSASGGARAR